MLGELVIKLSKCLIEEPDPSQKRFSQKQVVYSCRNTRLGNSEMEPERSRINIGWASVMVYCPGRPANDSELEHRIGWRTYYSEGLFV